LILEIGGGSTKIVYYNRRNILNHATLPFGAVTLTGLFSEDGLKPEEQAQKIEEYFTEQLKAIEWINEVDPDTQMIGVGGSFRNLFKISKMVHKYPLDTVHNFNMLTEDFLPVYDMIKVLDLDKKKKIKGLSADRADILPAALSLIKSFISYFHFDNFTISGAGLREGIMFNQAMPSTEEKPISDVLNYSLTTLVKYYGCEEKHVEHVVNLSIQLFKQLRVLHKFPRQYLRVLKVAATLHDCGMRIKYYNHQRHSCYMILNANLYGVSHREIVLAAFVACCHKKEDINAYEWARYRDILNEDDLEIVKRLGVMLRIAESLDRSMSGTVKSINCDILGDSVIMKTEVDGDATLEIRNAMAAATEFRKSFHKNLEIL
jgi:exopolyphosphatase/guanosine-5'-triphosphate,3'-diphosphate pyrophosphatase